MLIPESLGVIGLSQTSKLNRGDWRPRLTESLQLRSPPTFQSLVRGRLRESRRQALVRSPPRVNYPRQAMELPGRPLAEQTIGGLLASFRCLDLCSCW